MLCEKKSANNGLLVSPATPGKPSIFRRPPSPAFHQPWPTLVKRSDRQDLKTASETWAAAWSSLVLGLFRRRSAIAWRNLNALYSVDPKIASEIIATASAASTLACSTALAICPRGKSSQRGLTARTATSAILAWQQLGVLMPTMSTPGREGSCRQLGTQCSIRHAGWRSIWGGRHRVHTLPTTASREANRNLAAGARKRFPTIHSISDAPIQFRSCSVGPLSSPCSAHPICIGPSEKNAVCARNWIPQWHRAAAGLAHRMTIHQAAVI